MSSPDPDGRIQREAIGCYYCHKDVLVKWKYSSHGQCLGYMSDSSYVIIADVAYHSECWDELVKRNPP